LTGPVTPDPVAAPAAPEAGVTWRRWLDTEHLGLAFTLAYLFLSAVGVLHRAFVFLFFRINIFDYAEPSDFLLAALRDPLVILASIAPIPLTSLYYRGARWLQHRSGDSVLLTGGSRARAFSAKHRTTLYIVTVVLWALAFSLSYARKVSRDLRAGRGRRVQVDLISGSVRPPGDTLPVLLLGTTQKYVFLFDDARGITTVVPASNVAQLRYPGKPKARLIDQ
jgi:hypothetical protein